MYFLLLAYDLELYLCTDYKVQENALFTETVFYKCSFLDYLKMTLLGILFCQITIALFVNSFSGQPQVVVDIA